MDEHEQKHRDQGRFSARHAITGTGAMCGKGCATAYAQGLLQGAIDELIVLMGEQAAFEHVMKTSDGMVRAPGEPSKIWTPRS